MRRAWMIVFLLAVSCVSEQAPVSTSPTTTVPTPTSVPTTTSPDSTFVASTTTLPTTTTTLAPLVGLEYIEVSRIDFPIQMTAVPGSADAYLATKDGRVWLYDGTGISGEPVLDIRDRVRDSGEQGLLSIAVHQDLELPDPPRMWLHYSAGNGDTMVSEFTMLSRGLADRDSERVLLRLDQPAGNHNGGMLFLADDGHLYVGLGDGGGANDTYGNGQNRDTLLGGIVQLSIDRDPAPSLFQYGLRNPWRFWVDGDLVYVADVGQNQYEEITVAPFVADVNHGWPITEGLHCFRPSSGCDPTGITLPAIEVQHGDAGTCSITGGIVYRGSAIPELDGTFFFSDYCGGYLRGLRDGQVTDYTSEVGVPGRIVSFGVDGAGEHYVLTTNRVYKIAAVR